MPKGKPHDTIRAAVKARAEALGLTAYAVAKLTAEAGVGRPTTPDGVKDYFEGRSGLSSDRLDAVFAVLGLSVDDCTQLWQHCAELWCAPVTPESARQQIWNDSWLRQHSAMFVVAVTAKMGSLPIAQDAARKALN